MGFYNCQSSALTAETLLRSSGKLSSFLSGKAKAPVLEAVSRWWPSVPCLFPILTDFRQQPQWLQLSSRGSRVTTSSQPFDLDASVFSRLSRRLWHLSFDSGGQGAFDLTEEMFWLRANWKSLIKVHSLGISAFIYFRSWPQDYLKMTFI